MSIRQNLQDNLRQAARNLLNTPTKRYTAMGGLAAIVLVAYALLNQEAPAKPPIPEPIVQGQQLRFPAGHPQLSLLGTIEAKTAESITIELPARLVWNEERTQRIYPAFAGRVLALNADIGQSVNAGQVLATLASPEFGAAQADTAKAMADAQVAERALARGLDVLQQVGHGRGIELLPGLLPSLHVAMQSTAAQGVRQSHVLSSGGCVLGQHARAVQPEGKCCPGRCARDHGGDGAAGRAGGILRAGCAVALARGFEDQRARGLLACPTCGASDVAKAPMAPAVPAKGNQRQDVLPAQASQPMANTPMQPEVQKALAALAKVQAEVLRNSTWVGDRFVEETRKMHYGERKEALIHGQASLAEAKARKLAAFRDAAAAASSCSWGSASNPARVLRSILRLATKVRRSNSSTLRASEGSRRSCGGSGSRAITSD